MKKYNLLVLFYDRTSVFIYFLSILTCIETLLRVRETKEVNIWVATSWLKEANFWKMAVLEISMF